VAILAVNMFGDNLRDLYPQGAAADGQAARGERTGPRRSVAWPRLPTF
jgi:hypothetical protein